MSIVKQILDEFDINQKSVNEVVKPPKKTKNTKWNAQNIKPDAYNQIDLLYLPNDKGFKYLVVAVDVATRKTDFEPLKKRDGETVYKAIEKIYKRTILKYPVVLQIVAGSEFAQV